MDTIRGSDRTRYPESPLRERGPYIPYFGPVSQSPTVFVTIGTTDGRPQKGRRPRTGASRPETRGDSRGGWLPCQHLFEPLTSTMANYFTVSKEFAYPPPLRPHTLTHRPRPRTSSAAGPAARPRPAPRPSACPTPGAAEPPPQDPPPAVPATRPGPPAAAHRVLLAAAAVPAASEASAAAAAGVGWRRVPVEGVELIL